MHILGKVLVGGLAVIVFGATAYGYSTITSLNDGLARTNVIGAGAQDRGPGEQAPDGGSLRWCAREALAPHDPNLARLFRAAVERNLRFDPIACTGHGLCAALYPEGIHLDDWGYPILDESEVPPDLLGLARRAVDACPTLALLIDEG